jgi:CRP-like cAMP-binding protein
VGARALQARPELVSGMTAHQRKLVLQSAELQKFRANRVIVHGGDRTSSLFLLRKGRVKYYRVTEKGDEVILWWMAPSDVFGIGSLLSTPQRYIGTAEAIDDCEMLVWSREKIRPLAATIAPLAENAIQILMYYLATYADRMVGMTSDTAKQRLVRTILRLGRRFGHADNSGVELSITNDYLGRLANVSPFTVSRNMKQLERQGVIQKRRGKILILAPENLLID